MFQFFLWIIHIRKYLKQFGPKNYTRFVIIQNPYEFYQFFLSLFVLRYANTPKLYTTNGGITGECKVFCSRLATLLLIKDRAEIREKERKLTLLY